MTTLVAAPPGALTLPPAVAAGRAPAPARLDPRLYQIATLAALLAYGVLGLAFDVGVVTVTLIVAGTLMTQLACARLAGRPAEARSALISALSLCLLLRTSAPALAALAGVLAVAGKFLVRARGKHVFNPTNAAIVALLLLSDRVWVSPGQWGSGALFAFLLAAAGGLVVNRAARADVTGAFLAAHATLLLGRALWLGDPLAIALHRLESGALVLFAFFMISDPRTTPDARAGRVIFAVLVALVAYALQFRLFWTNPLLWSLALCAPAVPLLDRLLPGARYQWRTPR